MEVTTISKEDLIKELVEFYFGEKEYSFSQLEGGVNNFTYALKIIDNGEYVIRIYNNSNNTNRVILEHEVLRQLKLKDLSFSIPSPLEKEGKTHLKLKNGAEGTIFKKIKGNPPETVDEKIIKRIGEVAGELTNVLLDINVDNILSHVFAYPYYEIFKVHESINEELFLSEIKSEKFDGYREIADYFCEEIFNINEIFSKEKDSFPKQIIHADFHYDNLLIDDSLNMAVLDFEFVAKDWRVMDLVIPLSKFIGVENSLDLIKNFAIGFISKIKLEEIEIKYIPKLIKQRIYSNVVYFIGRYLSKDKTIDILYSKLPAYHKRIMWINSKEKEIIELFK